MPFYMRLHSSFEERNFKPFNVFLKFFLIDSIYRGAQPTVNKLHFPLQGVLFQVRLTDFKQGNMVNKYVTFF